MASKNNGYNVPIRTVTVAVEKNKLFIKSALSLLIKLNCIFCSWKRELLRAYKIKGPPTDITRITKIKIPLDGSEAKE